MKSFNRALIAIWKNEEGLTTVEYAVAGSLIALAVVTAFTNLGTQVGVVITRLYTAIGG
jgi:pilus assembly protein Flp/PilA